jgi:hypothetical protein
MALAAVIRANLERSIRLYDDLVAELPESALAMKLPGVPSNTIGAQLWCVVGARESYARAVDAGAWSGFSCSLTSDGSRDRSAVQAALARSAAAVVAKLAELESYDGARSRFIADLLEHEAAHQGQLIRYLYGLRLPIPDSWRARYALD